MARPRSTTGNEERCGEKRRGLAEPTTEPIPSAGPNTKTKTMKTTTTSVLLALALLPLAADAHGYMTKPPSRSDLAHETYVPENPEFCPHCVASVGQVSDCAGCGSRGYPQCGKSTSASGRPRLLPGPRADVGGQRSVGPADRHVAADHRVPRAVGPPQPPRRGLEPGVPGGDTTHAASLLRETPALYDSSSSFPLSHDLSSLPFS